MSGERELLVVQFLFVVIVFFDHCAGTTGKISGTERRIYTMVVHLIPMR